MNNKINQIKNENTDTETKVLPKEKNLRKPLVKKVFILLGILLGILLLLYIIGIFFNDDDNIDTLYSENQMRVIKNFGKPQTFKFVSVNDSKLEYWRYIYLDEVFVFQDGKYITTQHYNFDINDGEGIYINLEPADFYDTYMIEDINELVDTEPTLSADIDAGILGEGYKFYSYGKLLDITVHNGFIEVVDTLAYTVKNNDVSVTENKDEEKEEKGKVFVGAANLENSSFSYYLDNEVFRYIKQRPLIKNDSDMASFIYGYCYTLDNGVSFSDKPQDPYACADNESMLWTLEMYTIENYQSLDDTEKSYYEELAKNNEYVYLISHANGDFPSEIPTWPNILEDIKNDFSVPMAQKYADKINNSK